LRVIVVGGGFAGVAAAVALSEAGHRVELHEARSSLGGRSYHVPAPDGFPVPLDNGPHLFLGCYHQTFALLDKLGRDRLFHWIDPMELTWLLPGGKRVSLRAGSLPAPFHLIWGLLGSDAFPFAEKISLMKSIGRLHRLSLPGQTVAQFLSESQAGPVSRARFWGPFTRAVVNMMPEEAPLEALASALRLSFFIARRNGAFVVAKIPLGDLWGGSVGTFLAVHGGRLRLGSRVESVEIKGNRVVSACNAGGEKLEADAWVSAVPPAALLRLFPGEPWVKPLEKLGHSPMVCVHLHLDRPVLQGHLACLEGARFEFLFNRNANWDLRIPGQVLSFVGSADRDLVAKNEGELLDLARSELVARCPGASEARVLAGRVTKEMSATFAWTLTSGPLRPGAGSPLPNLALAGDWTDTGLPATIEGAVRSGISAAQSLPTHQ
jgi:zeta-carotene desaturase